jgi:hypothetical protein
VMLGDCKYVIGATSETVICVHSTPFRCCSKECKSDEGTVVVVLTATGGGVFADGGTSSRGGTGCLLV